MDAHPRLEIRPARPDDHSRVAQLTLDAYLPVLAFGADDPYRETLADAADRSERATLLVAVADDRPVGTLTLCRPGTPYAEVSTDDELEVRMLAVDPTTQQSGVGTALMAHAHAVAASEGYGAVVVSVIDTNVGAASFYESLGYVHDPRRDWTPVAHVRLLVWRREVRPAVPRTVSR